MNGETEQWIQSWENGCNITSVCGERQYPAAVIWPSIFRGKRCLIHSVFFSLFVLPSKTRPLPACWPSGGIFLHCRRHHLEEGNINDKTQIPACLAVLISQLSAPHCSVFLGSGRGVVGGLSVCVCVWGGRVGVWRLVGSVCAKARLMLCVATEYKWRICQTAIFGSQ